jgi:Leucine-rich repeat (LRR) protein
LTSLDISNLKTLTGLNIVNNQLKNLVIRDQMELTNLDCGNNLLDSLVLKNMPKLENVSCGGNNNFVKLDISNLPKLQLFTCVYGNVPKISFHNLPSLVRVECYYSKIDSLIFKNVSALTDLNCLGNNLKELILEDMPELNNFGCSENPLDYLIIQIGDLDGYLAYSGPPNLKYICSDYHLTDFFKEKHPSAKVNSFCFYEPGKKFYTAIGKTIFDDNNNGCDSSDFYYPFLKFSVDNGTSNGFFFTDELGKFELNIQEGNIILTPDPEILKHFTITPSFITLTSLADSIIQPFCIEFVIKEQFRYSETKYFY